MKKLLTLGLVGMLSGGLYAACIGPLCYDDSGTSSISGNVGISGTATVGSLSNSGVTVVGVVDVTVSTPSAVGQLVRTSANILYISTATATAGSWQKVGAQ